MNIDDMPEARDMVHMFSMRASAGWAPSLLTFMFHQMPGDRQAVQRLQRLEVERSYARCVTRFVRDPTSPSARDKLPIWLGWPDFPVCKFTKQKLRDVSVNDGQHVHVVALQPRGSRMRQHFATFVEENQQVLIGNDRCSRVHAAPIIHDLPNAMSYTWKTLQRGVVDMDSMILLPRCRSEVCDLPSAIGRNASIFAEGTCGPTDGRLPPAVDLRRSSARRGRNALPRRQVWQSPSL